MLIVALGAGNIKIIEMSDILVFGVLRITNIQKDAGGRDAKIGKDLFQRRTYFCCGFLHSSCVDCQLGLQALIGLASITLPKRGYDSFQELLALYIFIAERVCIFKKPVPDGFTQAIGIDHLREELIFYVRCTRIVVASNNGGTLSEKIDCVTEAGFIGTAGPDLFFKIRAEEMVRRIHVDTELGQTAELFKALVIHQCGVIPSILIFIIFTINCGEQRMCAAEKRFCRCLWLALFLYNYLLSIRNNNVKIRPINRVQGSSSFIQKVEFDVAVQDACILWRNDLCFIESHDFPKRLENGLIWCKYQRIMAETLVLRVFLC